MKVTLDPGSGFCFGVVSAVETAERELRKPGTLYCLGPIVHNNREVERLREMGLVTIGYEEFGRMHNCRVLIRAHGEPPETYRIALANNIELIDATCPVVLHLQQKIRKASLEAQKENGQVIIFGKKDHPEVRGLVGQTEGNVLVVDQPGELTRADLNRPSRVFAQTTREPEIYRQIGETLHQGSAGHVITDSICRQVSGRKKALQEFARQQDVIVFVSGKESSNGKVLFMACKEVNTRSYMITGPEELSRKWFEGVTSTGVCGATSTPLWLMQEVVGAIESIST